MAFTWDRYFETGIALVDQQHRGLVDLINALAARLAEPAAQLDAEVRALIDRLFDYAAQHFRAEERLMQAHGIDPGYLAAHRSTHRRFVAELVEIRSEVDAQGSAATAVDLIRFLSSWLTFHILDDDQRMAHQIAAIAAGKSPAEALAAAGSFERDDGARRALVLALVDLYAVVGERNASLRAANRRLQQAGQELEARVAERTAELQRSIAEMERTRSQLLQSEKMAAIGQLAAGVAHEINNPIGFVTSNVGSLEKYVQRLLDVIAADADCVAALPADDPRRLRAEAAHAAADLDFLREDIGELLTESTEGLDRVARIVQDLKDFSRVGGAELAPADINAGLDATLNVVWNEIKYKAEVVRNYGQLPPVTCVAAQINQVLMNLLVNAAQAIPERGTITLATGSAGDRVWIEVRDTGSGMDEATRRHIFEPFFTTKPVGKGTGLGLSISWDIIVARHHGSLSVDSAPGRGSCFRIELPIAGPG